MLGILETRSARRGALGDRHGLGHGRASSLTRALNERDDTPSEVFFARTIGCFRQEEKDPLFLPSLSLSPGWT